jgi:7,8-dihydropterin-6-yl-methyl-4-(beta-D-ribofuranosyl)aminobenzene 5'-phosphate synthase
MKNFLRCTLAFLFFWTAWTLPLTGQAGPKDITILYDNRPSDPACATDWGFSCLIRGFEKTILFDLGQREDVFLKNAAALKVDLKAVDVLVISHLHSDHLGAIGPLLNLKPNVLAYMPDDPGIMDQLFKNRLQKSGASFAAVAGPKEILPHVFLTGTMGSATKEQSLVLDTDNGLVIVTGCAHQGIVRVVERARSISKKEINLLLGGFHLLNSSEAAIKSTIDSFKEYGIRRIGATHCTGDKAIQMIKDAYKENFLVLGAGKKIILR